MGNDFFKKFFVVFAAGVVLVAIPLVYLEQRTLDEELLSRIHRREELLVPVAKAAEAAPDAASEPESYRVWVTAYSSTPEETDDTPFVTAKGTEVRDGIIAANFLPFGTEVRIPSLFGDKVFIVEDRMHQRKKNFVDIWMPTKEAAQQFGIARAEIVVL